MGNHGKPRAKGGHGFACCGQRALASAQQQEHAERMDFRANIMQSIAKKSRKREPVTSVDVWLSVFVSG